MIEVGTDARQMGTVVSGYLKQSVIAYPNPIFRPASSFDPAVRNSYQVLASTHPSDIARHARIARI